jgi:RNA polymerase sigma-70 factor (ECF subfamily)
MDICSRGRGYVDHFATAERASAAAQLDRVMGRYAAGETAAFGELYPMLAPRLYRLCLRLSFGRPAADDLFQDTLLRLHRGLPGYMPGAPVLPWACSIARSAHRDHLRARRRRPYDLPDRTGADSGVDSVPSREASPESTVRARDILSVIEGELRRMSEKNRSAYVLLRDEGLSVAEVALLLDTSIPVVKQRAHRAYEQIRDALRQAGWSQ